MLNFETALSNAFQYDIQKYNVSNNPNMMFNLDVRVKKLILCYNVNMETVS